MRGRCYIMWRGMIAPPRPMEAENLDRAVRLVRAVHLWAHRHRCGAPTTVKESAHSWIGAAPCGAVLYAWGV